MPQIYKPGDSGHYTPLSQHLRIYFSFCVERLSESSMPYFDVHIRPTETHVAKMANIETQSPRSV
jgi:hypothetical protein